MTVKENTICNLIQSFPVFLILAQNAQKCVKTPLIYKPPSPTHSPEYYEALEAVIQSLYGHGSQGAGHGSHGGGHGNGVYGGLGSHGIYGSPGSYGSNHGHGVSDHSYYYPGTTSSHCQYSYGRKWGSSSKPCYQYVYTLGNGYHSYSSGLQGYPSLALKKGNLYALNNVSTASYAPSQVYSTKNGRYQVVVKKTKIGQKQVTKQRRSRRNLGFFQPQGNQNNIFGQVLQVPKKIHQGIQGIFQPQRQRPAVINQETPQETIYVIETDGQGNGEYNSRPVVFDDGNGYQRPNQGFQDQGGFQPNGEGVNFDDRQQSGSDAAKQDGGQEDSAPVNDAVNFSEEPKVPETTTLPPLTPAPVVQTESRNSFNFGNSPVFGESCETIDGGLGSCISIYDCNQYLKIIQESRAQAMTILRRAHCGFEGQNPKVCCPRPGFPTPDPVPVPTTTTTTTTTTPAPTPAPTPSVKTASDFVSVLPDPPVCGTSNGSFSRVIGGVDAKLDDFPWMALLGYKSRRGGTSWLCGGTLISQRHVLTAAHCIHNHEDDLYVVRLGELDIVSEDDGAHPIDVLIKSKIKHEQYNAAAFTNDIAVLVLENDVEFTNSIKPICIPNTRELRSMSFEDYKPLIAGWGHTEFRGPAATHLQVLQIPVVGNDYCSQAYSAYKAQKIDERVLCAGYKKGGKDACQGDSGGPLMQPIWSPTTQQTFFVQIGVVSYGKKCAEAGFPGVYSRVTHFVPWIEEKVLGHSAR